MQANAQDTPPNPAFPVVVGLLAPWVLFLAAFTPKAYWPVTAGLLVILAALLLGAAAWSHQEARRLELDPAKWATLTILTLGAAMLLLTRRAANHDTGLQFLCHQCGHLGGLHEPFCYQCGSY